MKRNTEIEPIKTREENGAIESGENREKIRGMDKNRSMEKSKDDIEKNEAMDNKDGVNKSMRKRNGMSEQDIDRELELLIDDIPQQEDFEKKIDRYIKKKIRRITVKTVFVIFMIAAVLLFLISPAMDAAYLNPAKLQKDQTFLSVLRDYYDLTRPYIEIGGINIEKKGFAKYELGFSVCDNINSYVAGRENVRAEMALGQYKNWNDPQMLLVQKLGAFDHPITKNEIEELTEELEKLPESAQICLAVSEKEARDIADIQKEAVQLDWIEVYHPNQPEFQGGLNLWRSQRFDESDDRENMTEEELLDVYVENLQNLTEHPEIWSPLRLPYHSIVWEDGRAEVKECYEDAKTLSNLRTKAYYISGGRDEVIEYIKKTEMESLSVYDVKLSKWE